MHVSKPQFRFEWNLNTIVVLLGFAGGLVAWGYTLSAMQGGQKTNAEAIARVEERITMLETSSRMIDNHELRIGVIEAQVRDTSNSMRSLESTLNSLATDQRVMREILERLERSQGASLATR